MISTFVSVLFLSGMAVDTFWAAKHLLSGPAHGCRSITEDDFLAQLAELDTLLQEEEPTRKLNHPEDPKDWAVVVEW